MSTPHNRANPGDFAKTVLMPGDPLRAKFIAETFLENPRLVTDVRGFFFTGSRRWNPPHSLRRAGLLSAAQFRCGVHRGAKKMVVIGRTIWTFFLRAAGCYPQHNLRDW